MRDVVEVGRGRDELGASISVHVRQATFFGLETKSIGTTVNGRKKRRLNCEL